MEDGHCKTVEEVVGFFRVDTEKGLSLDQVKEYQKKYGPNGSQWKIGGVTHDSWNRTTTSVVADIDDVVIERSGHVELVPIYVSNSRAP